MEPCFGYSLKNASFAVAIMETIFALLTSTFYLMGLTAVQEPMELSQIKEIQSQFRIPFTNFKNPNITSEEIAETLTTTFSVGLVTSLIALGFGIFLFIGIRRTDIFKLKLWLIYQMTMIGLAGMYLVLMMVARYSTLLSSFIDLASLLVHLYFCWILYSFRKAIIEEQVLNLTPSIVQSKGKVDISFPM